LKKQNLKEKKRAISVRIIIDAAREIFVSLGYAGASMSQIAKKAKVAQGLLYHYFPSKEALWKAVKQDALNRSGFLDDFGGSQGNNFQDFLSIVLNNRFHFYEDNPDIKTIVAWEKLQSKGKELYGIDKTFQGMWHEDLTRLQKTGHIDNTIDADLLGIMIVSAFGGIFDVIPHIYDKSEVPKKQKDYLEMLNRCLMVLATFPRASK
jgi:AcrR family transcriptional regulator